MHFHQEQSKREVVAAHLAGAPVLGIHGFGARLQAFVFGGEALDLGEGASAFLRFPEALSNAIRRKAVEF